jgi:hypothetical protein
LSNYKKFIETRLKVIDKDSQVIPFKLNAVQDKFVTVNPLKAIILKARQQGFSSLILAMFTMDFILKENINNVVVADITDNAEALLDRVKFFLNSYEDITGVKVPLKYNSKYELQNSFNGSKYSIGTAKNTEFGRSRTINNLHMSEAAFYPNLEKMLAGALQAVVPTGRVVIETTANGFNDLKELWDEAELGNNGFTPMFFNAQDFYTPEFLEIKKKELGRLYTQEYPSNSLEAFVTSGQCYFNVDSLQGYLTSVQEPYRSLNV